MLYNHQGMLNEKFVLVELPNVLYAGFYWTLRNLQIRSEKQQQIAFLSTIAPSVAGSSPEVGLPKYADSDQFRYQLDVLCRDEALPQNASLTFSPRNIVSDIGLQDELIETLEHFSTLDPGQSRALCESLCRGLAFTQGPPGTGKS